MINDQQNGQSYDEPDERILHPDTSFSIILLAVPPMGSKCFASIPVLVVYLPKC